MTIPTLWQETPSSGGELMTIGSMATTIGDQRIIPSSIILKGINNSTRSLNQLFQFSGSIDILSEEENGRLWSSGPLPFMLEAILLATSQEKTVGGKIYVQNWNKHPFGQISAQNVQTEMRNITFRIN